MAEITWQSDAEVLGTMAQDARMKRDALLDQSDPMALPDYPHQDDATRQAWMDYRQALRDMTAQPGFPDAIDWPEDP